MDQSLPSALTTELISSINEKPGEKLHGVAQFVLHLEQTLKEKKLYSARLSDGVFFADFLLYPNISPQFLEQVKPKDIVEVGLLKKDANSPYLLIFEFRLVYSGYKDTIGTPIPYVSGATNPHGSHLIPPKPAQLPETKDELQPQSSSQILATQNRRRMDPEYDRYDDYEPVTNEVLFTSIANLNMYDRSWSIRGRIVKKSELKRFKSSTKEGSVFNIVVKDETRAIQGSFFNEIAHKYFSFIKEGRMYSFSDGEIKSAGRFNCTDNKYEINFNDKSTITEIENDNAIASFHFNLVPIQEISKKSENDVFDVLAIVEDPGSIKEVNLKNGTSTDKKTLGLVDQTGFKVDLTIWGQAAHEINLEAESIAIFQDIRVKDYNGKSLSFSMGSRIITKIPDSSQVRSLLLYRNSRNSSSQNYRSLTEPMNLAKMRLYKIAQLAQETSMLMDDQEGTKLYFTVVAHIMRVVNNLYYDSCPNDGCMKKLNQGTKGLFYCEKCHKSFEKPKARFMAAFKFADETGVVNVMCSGEEYSQLIFNCVTEKLRDLKENNENDLNEFVKDHLFCEFKLRLLAKKDFFNNEPKVKFQAIKISPISKNLEYISDSYFEMVSEKYC